MAHKKAGGSTAWGRDSQSKRLGIKMSQGQSAKPGSILVRQRGSKYRPGQNVKIGGDDTLYSLVSGLVKFSKRKITKFNGRLEKTPFVHVVPHTAK